LSLFASFSSFSSFAAFCFTASVSFIFVLALLVSSSSLLISIFHVAASLSNSVATISLSNSSFLALLATIFFFAFLIVSQAFDYCSKVFCIFSSLLAVLSLFLAFFLAFPCLAILEKECSF
jgi:hypothetical protein